MMFTLSLGSGAALTAALSAVLIWWATPRALSDTAEFRPVAWVIAIAVPLAISYCLYWVPYWFSAFSDQASLWADLIIGVWFVAGTVTSVLALLIRTRRLRRGARRGQQQAGTDAK
ncbi:MAG: hypothetical protein ACHQIL_02865 [Steroidobacterales bacterium]